MMELLEQITAWHVVFFLLNFTLSMAGTMFGMTLNYRVRSRQMEFVVKESHEDVQYYAAMLEEIDQKFAEYKQISHLRSGFREDSH